MSDRRDLSWFRAHGTVRRVTPPTADDTWPPWTGEALPPLLSLADAEAQLRATVEAVAAQWTADSPTDPKKQIIHGITADTGLGKSHALRLAVARALGEGRLRQVVWAVPRHNLGEEALAAFQALGVRAAIWRGRRAQMPDGTPMCRNLDAVSDAERLGEPVQTAVCAAEDPATGQTRTCPHFTGCAYQAQAATVAGASVVLVAHDVLFAAKPAAIPDPDLLVVDEAFWPKGLAGIDPPITLTVDGLRPEHVQCWRTGAADPAATADLRALRARLIDAIERNGPGPLRRESLTTAGLTAAGLRTKMGHSGEGAPGAKSLEYARRRGPVLAPGMTAAERAQAIDQANTASRHREAPIGRCAALWGLLEAALEAGRDAAGVILEDRDTDAGPVRHLRLLWRRGIAQGWRAPHGVLLDATTPEALQQAYFPDLVAHAPVRVAMPRAPVTQVMGAPHTARKLAGSEAEAASRRAQIMALIRAQARRYRGRGAAGIDVLVVAQKAIREALEAEGLPEGVAMAHFGDLTGLDRWRGVRCLMVIGRPLPPPGAVEAEAIALTGRTPAAVPPPQKGKADWWWRSTPAPIRCADGQHRQASAPWHPDAVVAAIREAIAEGEVIQAIGRGRGARRTEATPLDTWLLGDLPLPGVAVSRLLRWKAIQPDRMDQMAAQGVWLDSRAHRARCFPQLWDTAEAAKKDAQRAQCGTNAYREFLYREMSPTAAEMTYQIAGARQRPQRARFDLAVIPEPRPWLEDRLGPLAMCEVIAPPRRWAQATAR